MRTSNPTLNLDIFRQVTENDLPKSRTMTIDGTVNRTIILLILLVLSAAAVWGLASSNPGAAMGLGVVGAIGGLIVSLVTFFKKELSHITAPIYSVLEGLFIGSISAFFEARYPGIVMQAVSLTFGTLFGLLFAYKSGWIRATEKFKTGVISATLGLGVVYLVAMVLSLFGIKLSFIFGSGLFGILFSVFVVGLAALNLVLDFDLIETGARENVPKYMEWYSGFTLMVTLVWLYIEILRLLVKLKDRD